MNACLTDKKIVFIVLNELETYTVHRPIYLCILIFYTALKQHKNTQKNALMSSSYQNFEYY